MLGQLCDPSLLITNDLLELLSFGSGSRLALNGPGVHRPPVMGLPAEFDHQAARFGAVSRHTAGLRAVNRQATGLDIFSRQPTAFGILNEQAAALGILNKHAAMLAGPSICVQHGTDNSCPSPQTTTSLLNVYHQCARVP